MHVIAPQQTTLFSTRCRTLFKHQLAAVVGRVAADVLLYVGVLVVVDPDALVPRGGGQPADQTGLPHGRLPLDQHRVGPGWDKSFREEGVGWGQSERRRGGQTIDLSSAQWRVLLKSKCVPK